MGYTSIIQNLLYGDRQQIREKSKRVGTKKEFSNTEQRKNKFDKIHQFVLQNELYLEPEMTLFRLSEKLEINEGYLSQIINKQL